MAGKLPCPEPEAGNRVLRSSGLALLLALLSSCRRRQHLVLHLELGADLVAAGGRPAARPSSKGSSAHRCWSRDGAADADLQQALSWVDHVFLGSHGAWDGLDSHRDTDSTMVAERIERC